MEDERAAASIQAGISSQVFAASLVLIAILLGLLDIKEIAFCSLKGIFITISIILLLLSLYFAGKGLKQLRIQGARGNWNLDNLHWYFNLQTFLNITAIILFIFILLLPDKETKQDAFQRETISLQRKILVYDSLIFEQGKQRLEILNAKKIKVDSLNCVDKKKTHMN